MKRKQESEIVYHIKLQITVNSFYGNKPKIIIQVEIYTSVYLSSLY